MTLAQYRRAASTLDAASPTMCAAKWSQITLNLHSGNGRSCCHSPSYNIPSEGLQENPILLYNTPGLIRDRQELMGGVASESCSYCWKLEKVSPTTAWERYIKSGATWSSPILDKIEDGTLRADEPDVPPYVEVMFSRVCDFSCVYCSPDISSKIFADMFQHGPYILSDGSEYVSPLNVLPRGRLDNPYVKAFYAWLPTAYAKLHMLRVTGGEPTAQREFWELLSYVKAEPNGNLDFAINTNLGFDVDTRHRLLTNLLEVNQMVKTVRISSSLESTGKQAEWSRRGLNFAVWKNNLDTMLHWLQDVTFNVTTTVNSTCYNTFGDFLDLMNDYKRTYGDRFTASFNYLRNPRFLDLAFLPEHLKNKMIKDIEERYRRPNSFSSLEASTLRRLVDYIAVGEDAATTRKQNADLYCYAMESDKRRRYSTDTTAPPKFAELFPELYEAIAP